MTENQTPEVEKTEKTLTRRQKMIVTAASGAATVLLTIASNVAVEIATKRITDRINKPKDAKPEA